MDIDPYSPCPGGTGKKIKFCCADLTAELDKLSHMIRGEQRAAALEFVESLEAKFPDRACLLSTKAMLQAELGQAEKAAVTVGRFREKHPDNPVALAETAVLQARDNPGAAVIALQHALEHSDQQVSMQVYDALGVVGMSLLTAGETLAAWAHWLLQMALSGGKDEQVLRLLSQLQSSPEIHLLLKEHSPLVEPPADALWRKGFEAALVQARAGRWLAAADAFQQLADQAGNWPAIAHNIAVLRSWLAQNPAAIRNWREFAGGDVPFDDAVEAEATAQLLDREHEEFVDVVRRVYPIRDIEALLIQLGRNRQALRAPVDLASLSAADEPPPKGLFSLLDRPRPESAAGLSIDAVPQIVGQALIYGKQTDREARLELVASRTELEAGAAALAAVAGDSLGPQQSEEVTGQTPLSEEVLALKWYLPEETSPAERRALLLQGHRRTLQEKWANLPQKLFGGKSAREAAGNQQTSRTVAAAILLLDLRGDELLTADDFNQLRRSLGLPEAGLIDPSTVSVITLPVARLARLDVGRLSDQDLIVAFERAQEVHYLRALRLLGHEIVRRPSIDKELDKPAMLAMLAQIENELAAAVSYLDEARRLAEAGGKSSARFDLVELAVRMRHGDVAEADRVLRHIRDQHLREPGIAQALYGMLSQWGLVRPDGSMPAAEPAAGQPGIVVPGAAPAQQAGKLWTPGSEPAGGGAKKSAIWTPGMQ